MMKMQTFKDSENKGQGTIIGKSTGGIRDIVNILVVVFSVLYPIQSMFKNGLKQSHLSSLHFRTSGPIFQT